MERISKRTAFLVSPAMAVVWASIIAAAIVFGLRQWPGSETWLANQNRFFTFAIYFACWFAAYVVAFVVVANVAAPIHYAVDPAYATERAHKRRVKQLQVGQRIRVTDTKGEDHGTITRIDPSGENFDVTWDDDGHTKDCHHRRRRHVPKKEEGCPRSKSARRAVQIKWTRRSPRSRRRACATPSAAR